MFIEITRRLSQAPEERHMADVAPPELGKLLPNVFYKHYAPPALQNMGIRQQYLKSPHSKDSVNLRTALILHIVDALEV